MYVTDVDAWWTVTEEFGRRTQHQGWSTASGTLLGISRLAQPELLIEIEAIAVK
jgi:enamine deaminase RidA (YjgF/YER057c/UK114 family)